MMSASSSKRVGRRCVCVVGGSKSVRDELCTLLCEEYDDFERVGEADASNDEKVVKVAFPERRLGIKFKGARIDSASAEANNVGVRVGDVFHQIEGELVQNDVRHVLTGIALDRRIMEMVVSRPERPLNATFLRPVAPSADTKTVAREKVMARLRGLRSNRSVLLQAFPVDASHVEALSEAGFHVDYYVVIDGGRVTDKDVSAKYTSVLHQVDGSLSVRNMFAEVSAILNISQPKQLRTPRKIATSSAADSERSEQERKEETEARDSATKTSNQSDSKGASGSENGSTREEAEKMATFAKRRSRAMTPVKPTRVKEHCMIWSCNTTIAAGASFELPIVVPCTHAKLSWSFKTDGGDVIFGATFFKAINGVPSRSKITEIESPNRVASHVEEVGRNVELPSDGVVTLVWDNCYSWFAEKPLRYTVTLDMTEHHRRLKLLKKLQSKAKAVVAVMELQRLKRARVDRTVTKIQKGVRGLLGRRAAVRWASERAHQDEARERLQRVARGAIGRSRARAQRAEKRRVHDLMGATKRLERARLHLEALDRLCDRHSRSFTLSSRSISTKARDMQERIDADKSSTDEKHLSMLKSQVAEWDLESELLDQCLKSLSEYHKVRASELEGEIKSLMTRIESLKTAP